MTAEITRRVGREGMLTEHVLAWHYREEGPGEPGGRSYDVLYARDGRIRIDVSGCWGSFYHTVWLGAGEIRPREEYIDHLLATGQTAKVRHYCQHCGLEKPDGPDYSCLDGCRDYIEP